MTKAHENLFYNKFTKYFAQILRY